MSDYNNASLWRAVNELGIVTPESFDTFLHPRYAQQVVDEMDPQFVKEAGMWGPRRDWKNGEVYRGLSIRAGEYRVEKSERSSTADTLAIVRDQKGEGHDIHLSYREDGRVYAIERMRVTRMSSRDFFRDDLPPEIIAKLPDELHSLPQGLDMLWLAAGRRQQSKD